ncbi:hypothetical protein [Flaviflexus massiliensis]|uniref:hypothetical protein n=1 Tax=Flaviflexus massiliensis TaxID=1522309 RepID=UPI0006D58995|nr:hypothetical protein [Flaviflexus massiliensis]
MTTHQSLADAIDRAEARTVGPMFAWIFGVLAVAFLLTAVLPGKFFDSSLDVFLTYAIATSEQHQFLTVANWAIGAGAIFILVMGIGTAAEFRSYLGAGVTRMAIWRNGRFAAFGLAIMLTGVIIAVIALGLLFDGAFGQVHWGKLALLILGIAVAYWAIYEFGFYQGFMWVRFGALPALLATIPVLLIALFLIEPAFNPEYWALICIAIILLITFVTSYRAALTIPMRRNS